MGIRGLYTYIRQRRDILQEYQTRKLVSPAPFIPSSPILHIAVDGLGVECFIEELLMTRSPIKACSYEYLYEFTTNFFEALQSCNIVVDAYFVDTLFDMDKVETVTCRCESNQNRGKLI